MIVVEGLKPTLIGVVLGLVLAAALVRVMSTLLFGVSQPIRHLQRRRTVDARGRCDRDLLPAYIAHARRSDRHAALRVGYVMVGRSSRRFKTDNSLSVRI